MKKKTINLDLYDCKINFYLVNSFQEVETLQSKIYKKHKIKEDIIKSYGIVIPTFKTYYIIVAKIENWINTFFHEIYHLTDLITKERCIEDAESKAYLQGLIGEKLFNHVISTSSSNITSVSR